MRLRHLLANGEDAATAVQQRSGVTGEKMELDGYNFLEGENLSVYDHMNKHTRNYRSGSMRTTRRLVTR